MNVVEVRQSPVDELERLRHQVAALEQLFELYEQTAIAQAAKLEMLVEEQRLLDAFLQYVPVHVFFKDRNSRFVRISHALSTHFGLSDPSLAVNKTDFDMFSGEHAEQAFADEQEVMRTARPLPWKEEKETWQGREDTWALTTKVPLHNTRGEIIGTMGISHDITARKQAEDQLRAYKAHLEEIVEARTAELKSTNEQLERDIAARELAEQALALKAQELARSNADLERFAYVASHDLQEPLRMVASFTQLLARRYKGKLDAEADEFIAFAVDGANRMQHLIQDLLSYSRLTTRGKRLEPTESRVACDNAVKNLSEAIRDSGAILTVGTLPLVLADSTQLAQLFQNLIGNAIKYRGGNRTPEIRVAAQENGTDWIFSVADNGIGIEPQYFERIFQMFQRLHTRNEYSGTGIGLAICRKIVERHGGRVWVESQPGHGSTFFFTIPIEQRAKQ
jgi:PAS domain S-box-containing protein